MRQWPEGEKDLQIKAKLAEQARAEEELRKQKEEEERVAKERALMLNEDSPALDLAEIEAIKQK